VHVCGCVSAHDPWGDNETDNRLSATPSILGDLTGLWYNAQTYDGTLYGLRPDALLVAAF